MPESELKRVTENAQMIVGGYAFTEKDGNISILNLSNPDYSMLISREGIMLETNMEPIEQTLVLRYWSRNSSFMEENDA